MTDNKLNQEQRRGETQEKTSSFGDSSNAALPGNSSPGDHKAEPATTREDGKIEIKEEDHGDKLGYAFTPFRKWTILTVIFWVQVSMNFNTSIYANTVEPLTKAFKTSGLPSLQLTCARQATGSTACDFLRYVRL